MNAVDTNVIVRYLVGDDAQQAEAARALLDRFTPHDPAFICREVVMEVAWVLERSYRFPRSRVAEALMDSDRLRHPRRGELRRRRRGRAPVPTGRR